METYANLISHYGLWVVAFSAFFQGPMIVIGAGFLAANHLILPQSVVVIAAIFAWLGHLFWYYLGQKFQIRLLESDHAWKDKLEPINRFINTHPWLSVVGLQYGEGVKILGAVAFGVANLSLRWFMLVQAVNCLVWSSLFVILGYGLAQSLPEDFYMRLRYLFIAITCLLLFFLIQKFMLNHRNTVSASGEDC